MFVVTGLICTVVDLSFFFPIGIALLAIGALSLVLHLLGRFFLISSHRRRACLFSETPWLPLRHGVADWPEQEIEFPTAGKLVLRGHFLPFLPQTTTFHQGTILFFHELNGNRKNIEPFTQSLRAAGFDIFSFDFRNHGTSDSVSHSMPTPWITSADMEDATAALKYVLSRSDVDKNKISVFGLGKGATVALCLAGSDSKIKSLVLDAPIPENRLFAKNCWDILVKSTRLSRRRFSKFSTLFFRAVLYSAACPILTLGYAWRRKMLGLWFGCHFINPWPLVKKVHQPMMIVHGQADSMTRAAQIQAFCDRMAIRPKLWLAPAALRGNQAALTEDCSQKMTRFLTETA